MRLVTLKLFLGHGALLFFSSEFAERVTSEITGLMIPVSARHTHARACFQVRFVFVSTIFLAHDTALCLAAALQVA